MTRARGGTPFSIILEVLPRDFPELLGARHSARARGLPLELLRNEQRHARGHHRWCSGPRWACRRNGGGFANDERKCAPQDAVGSYVACYLHFLPSKKGDLAGGGPVVCALKEAHACPWRRSDAGCTVSPEMIDVDLVLSRSGIAAERLRSPSVSAPHRESLARPTGPGLLTYLIVPKVPKGLTFTVN